MLFGNKTIGLEQLDSIKQAIEQADMDSTLCDEYKNLLLWNGFQTYMQNILAKFDKKTKYDLDVLSKVVETLKLDEIYINMKISFNKNKEMLASYIEQISKELVRAEV